MFTCDVSAWMKHLKLCILAIYQQLNFYQYSLLGALFVHLIVWNLLVHQTQHALLLTGSILAYNMLWKLIPLVYWKSLLISRVMFTYLCLCLCRMDEVPSHRLRKQRLKLAKDHGNEPVHSNVPRAVDMGALCIWARDIFWEHADSG